MIRNASRACGAPFPNLLRAQPLVFIAGHPLTFQVSRAVEVLSRSCRPCSFLPFTPPEAQSRLGVWQQEGIGILNLLWEGNKVKTFSTSFSGTRFSKLLALVYFHTPFFLCSCLCLSVCRGAASPCLVWCSHHWQQETSDTWAQVCVEPWSTQYLSWYHCPLQSPHSVCWCCFAVKLSSLVFL